MGVKVIALYLPQYHSIKENSEWWGEGFTDWVNVKKARKISKNQYQPRKPMGDNYYDLLNIEVMVSQAKIAKEYGVYGFCYYHYWFNGKLLLESPLENMLTNKRVSIPFCLSWANEPWTRAWDGGEREILMRQEYGAEDDWVAHFNYLVKFFKDERYIKINNMPILVIYRTESIENVNKMVDVWNRMAMENGFSGIYLVETLNSFQRSSFVDNSKAMFEFEPMYTISKQRRNLLSRIYHRFLMKRFGGLTIRDYDSVWGDILSRSRKISDKKLFLGAFVDWDNTPRKGNRGLYIRGMTANKFRYYFSRQVSKAKNLGSEYIFLNAWNEWAEGTYLEPDDKYGYGILEAVKESVLGA